VEGVIAGSASGTSSAQGIGGSEAPASASPRLTDASPAATMVNRRSR
jgi:hypothetical protein